MLQYVDICPGDDDETSGRELRHRSRDFAGGDEDKLRGWTFYIGDVAEDLGLDAFKGWAPMQYHSLMEVVSAPGWRLWGCCWLSAPAACRHRGCCGCND